MAPRKPIPATAAGHDGDQTDLDDVQGDDQPPPAPLPSSVKLKSLYAFFDDQNRFCSWAEGQVVSDPETIRTLIERQAPVEATP